MDVSPCENCTKLCPYQFFIDCPDWLAWAVKENRAETEDEGL